MEVIRNVKITVEIHTNKKTYRESFDTMNEAKKYYDEFYDLDCEV